MSAELACPLDVDEMLGYDVAFRPFGGRHPLNAKVRSCEAEYDKADFGSFQLYSYFLAFTVN